jgi:hypothetical protein
VGKGAFGTAVLILPGRAWLAGIHILNVPKPARLFLLSWQDYRKAEAMALKDFTGTETQWQGCESQWWGSEVEPATSSEPHPVEFENRNLAEGGCLWPCCAGCVMCFDAPWRR